MLYPDTIHNSQSQFFPVDTWKKPLTFAITLHLLVFVLAILPPSFFGHKREVPEVVTINLFTAMEMQESKPAPKAPVKPKPQSRPKPKPLPTEKPRTSISQESPAPAPPPSAPADVISLKPRKIKKAPPKPEKKEKTLEDKRQDALQRVQAMVNKKQEEERLKHDLAELRESLHTEEPDPEPAPATAEPVSQATPVKTASPGAGTPGPSMSSGESVLLNLARNQYVMSINRKIQDHWILPEMQNWDDSLETILVIVIRRDGVVIKRFFEKKSNNIYFDQFVEKTVEEAFPLPPFPSSIKDSTMEFGLIFQPGGLF